MFPRGHCGNGNSVDKSFEEKSADEEKNGLHDEPWNDVQPHVEPRIRIHIDIVAISDD